MEADTHTKQPLSFIVDPKAGHGRAGAKWPALRRAAEKARLSFNWAFTRGPDETAELACRSADDAVVVAVGGDDTLTDVVRGLSFVRSPRVAVIPCGTTNDFAVTIGMSRRPLHALHQLIHGEEKPVDLPAVNGIPFLTTAWMVGEARDPLVRLLAKDLRRRSFSPLHFYSALARTPARPVAFDVDGRHFDGRAKAVAVGNSRFWGDHRLLHPSASVDDGLLDVAVTAHTNFFDQMTGLMAALTQRHLLKRSTTYTKAHRLEINGPDAAVVVVDGRIIRTRPAIFTVGSQSFRVTMPKGVWQPSKIVSIMRYRAVESLPTVRR